MTSLASPSSPAAIPRRRYLLLALVCATIGQAAAERASLSIAGPTLSKTMGLDAVAMGWLFSAFAWSYVIAHLPAGWVLDRLGARRTVLVGLLTCAAASALTGISGLLPGAFVFILGLRVLTGVMQAPYGPAAGVTIAAWFPSRERGMAGAIFGSAVYLALALYNPLLGWVTEHQGWPVMMGVVSIGGLALSAWWWRSYFLPGQHPSISAEELTHIRQGGAMVDIGTTAARRAAAAAPPMGPWQTLRFLFSNRMVLGLFIAHYSVASITWFFVSWFPTYLVQARGYSLVEAGSLAALPALCCVAGAVLSGQYSDRLLTRTGSLTIARKWPVYIGMGISAAGMLACLAASEGWMVVALMSLAFFGKGFGTLAWTIVADISPVSVVGLTGSIYNAIGNISGITTPVIIGYLVAADPSFDSTLILMASLAITAMLVNFWMVGRIERLHAPENSTHSLPARDGSPG